MTAFTPTHRSKVKRLHERGRYDEESVFAVLDAGLVAHIGYVIEGQPYVTPTAYWRRGRTLFSARRAVMRSTSEKRLSVFWTFLSFNASTASCRSTSGSVSARASRCSRR